MKARSADGVEGILIYVHAENTFVFRVYDADFNFVDYDILHNDLAVTIRDSDAWFYEREGNTWELDHSPATLGRQVDGTGQVDSK